SASIEFHPDPPRPADPEKSGLAPPPHGVVRLPGRRGRPPARPEVPDRIEVVMNVRVFLGDALLLFALALVSSCSTHAKSPLQPSTKLEGSSLDAAAVFGGSSREGGFGAFELRELRGGGGGRFLSLRSCR